MFSQSGAAARRARGRPLCSLRGPKFCSMKISQDLRRDAAVQNDAGANLAEAEAGMAEMSARFRAGGGVVEVKV